MRFIYMGGKITPTNHVWTAPGAILAIKARSLWGLYGVGFRVSRDEQPVRNGLS